MSNELKWHEVSLFMDCPTRLDSTVTGFVSGPSGACLHWEGGRKGPAHQEYDDIFKKVGWTEAPGHIFLKDKALR